MEQKTQQLCRQVQRALNLALTGQFIAGALEDVFVMDVSATAGCGRLVAYVAVPAGHWLRHARHSVRNRRSLDQRTALRRPHPRSLGKLDTRQATKQARDHSDARRSFKTRVK